MEPINDGLGATSAKNSGRQFMKYRNRYLKTVAVRRATLSYQSQRCSMGGIEGNLTAFFDRYVSLERDIQKLMAPLSRRYCVTCAGKCCREEICKESIESTFLSALVEKQRIRYDNKNGWLGAQGCRLAFGRPVVCYDFFCEEVRNRNCFMTGRLRAIIHDFVSLGNRAHGNIHLLCIADLELLSPQKIDQLCCRAGRIQNQIANVRARSGIKVSGRASSDFESMKSNLSQTIC